MFSIVVSIPFYSSPAVGWSCLVNTTYMFQSPTPALPPPDPDTCALARRPQTDMFVAEAKQRATRDPEQDKTFWEKYVRPVMVLRIFHSTLDLFILCSSFAFSIPLSIYSSFARPSHFLFHSSLLLVLRIFYSTLFILCSSLAFSLPFFMKLVCCECSALLDLRFRERSLHYTRASSHRDPCASTHGVCRDRCFCRS